LNYQRVINITQSPQIIRIRYQPCNAIRLRTHCSKRKRKIFDDRAFLASVIDAREGMRTLEKLKQNFLYQSGSLNAVRERAGKCFFPDRLQNPDKPWSGKENLA